MKRIISYSLFVICLLLSSMVFSQENNDDLSETLKRKNIVDVTIGGSGLLLYTNYSMVITEKSNYFIIM